MFENAGARRVRSTFQNLEIRARGDTAFLSANFRLELSGEGPDTSDEGRQTVVFERRGGVWVVVHRHTSFQAPPGPQRAVPIHTEPGPLWNPTLEGAWRGTAGAMLVASATHVMISGVPGLPSAATYKVDGKRIRMSPVSDTEQRLIDLDEVALTATGLAFRLPGQKTVWEWARVE